MRKLLENILVIGDLGRQMASVCLSFVFSYMLVFFAPMEMYLLNSADFRIDLSEFFKPVILCFLGVFVLLMILSLCVNWLVNRFLPKLHVIYDFFLAIWLALFLALYIQGNYIPRNYGVLDGGGIDFSQFRGTAIASYVVWIASLLIIMITWIVFLKKSGIFNKIIICTTMLVFTILTIALTTVWISNKPEWKREVVCFSHDNINTLSSNHNIIVLVLDMFDAGYLEEAIEDDANYIGKVLEDFTFYNNTSGAYMYTLGTIPYLLNGVRQKEGEEYKEYVENAYRKGKLFRILYEKEYSVECDSSTQETFPLREGFVDNLYLDRFQIGSMEYFLITLYKYVAYEYFPQQIKGLFLVDTRDFNQCISDETEGLGTRFTNERFYRRLEQGITVGDYENVFRFIHIEGMHDPYMNTSDVYEDGKGHTYNETLIANLKIVDTYLGELKKAGVYDCSEIYIMADHGADDVSELRVRPLFMHKSVGEHHAFEISNKAMSYDDFYGTLMQSVTGDSSYKAMWDSKETDERYFINGEYKIEGDLSTSGYRLIQIKDSK